MPGNLLTAKDGTSIERSEAIPSDLIGTPSPNNPAESSLKSFTIWDIVNTIDIEHLVTALRQLSYGTAAFQHQHDQRMDLGAMGCVCDALEKCLIPFHEMGFKTSAGMISKFLDSAGRNLAHGDWTGAQFSEKCHAVFSAIQIETTGIICLKMGAVNSPYFNKHSPFGKFVAAEFSECGEDIAEAHQCIAFERYTASMFHLGRAMEVAVKKVAKRMRVKPRRDEWQAYLSAMNEKINKMPFKKPAQKSKRQVWAETAGHLFNFKEAWRNPTFHAKKTYTPDEALAALSNAGLFMDYVARKIFKAKA